jgi:cyclohexadienyl dehydratase
VQAAARSDARAAPAPLALEKFFGALLEASRGVQSAVLAAPAPASPASVAAYDLDTQLRPALTRITERIAALVPRLPTRLSESALSEELAARDAGLPGFGADERTRLAAALAELASADRAP